MERDTNEQRMSFPEALKVTGAVASASGLLGGLLFAFVLPSSRTVLSGLGLLLAGMAFVAGVVCLGVGFLLGRGHSGPRFGPGA